MQTKPRGARVHVQGVGHNALNIALNGVVTIAAKAHTLTVGSNTISATHFRNTILVFEITISEVPRFPRRQQRPGAARPRRTETGGFLTWTEDDMSSGSTDVRHSAPRLPTTGGAYRFGPPHLRQIVRRMAVQIETEKSRGNTIVTVPVHPEFEESLRAARAAGSSAQMSLPAR
jgi:hypothetical protein